MYIDEYCYKRSAIAKKVGLSPQLFTHILNGNVRLKVEDYKKICSAMGITPAVIDDYKPYREDLTIDPADLEKVV